MSGGGSVNIPQVSGEYTVTIWNILNYMQSDYSDRSVIDSAEQRGVLIIWAVKFWNYRTACINYCC